MIVAAITSLWRGVFAPRALMHVCALLAAMCVADAARAAPEPVQLQLQGSSRIAGWISTDGFPALSESGEELAVLLGSNPPGDEFAVLEIRAVPSGKTLQRYELVEEFDELRLHLSTRDLLASKIAAALDAPNQQLRACRFQAMQLKLFDMDLETDARESWQRGSWEGERLGLRIRLLNSETVTLSMEDDHHRLHAAWSPKDLGYPRETGDSYHCFSFGMPSRAWLHPGRRFVIVEVQHPGNHHSSCDEATDWQIEELVPIGAAVSD